jgi:hypothetical protein
MVPAVLGFSLSHAASARRLLADTAPSAHRAVAVQSLVWLLASCHLKLIISFALNHARHAGHSFVRTHEPYESLGDKKGDWQYRRLSYQGRGVDTGSVA